MSDRTPYPARMKALARQMYADGNAWNPYEIQRYLQRHAKPGERVPGRTTIRYWVRDAQADQHREEDRVRRQIARARKVLERHGPRLVPAAATDEELTRQLKVLRAHGLSYSAIAKIAQLYHGAALTEEQIRYRLRRRGVEPDPVRSAAARVAVERRQAQERAA